MVIIGVKIDGRTGEDSDFEMIRIDEVNYINMYRPRKSAEQIPIYHTSRGTFAALQTLKDVSKALRPHGFAFFDRSTVVNRRRIKRIDRTKEGLNIIFVDLSTIVVSARSRMK